MKGTGNSANWLRFEKPVILNRRNEMDLTNLTIEELQKRIYADGPDAADCVKMAERLIRKEAALCGAPDFFATAVFLLWRQGEITVETASDGRLALYKPYVQ